jgi:hypothetical protein
MRRFLLIFTLLSVPGWSQPAQQAAQPEAKVAGTGFASLTTVVA